MQNIEWTPKKSLKCHCSLCCREEPGKGRTNGFVRSNILVGPTKSHSKVFWKIGSPDDTFASKRHGNNKRQGKRLFAYYTAKMFLTAGTVCVSGLLHLSGATRNYWRIKTRRNKRRSETPEILEIWLTDNFFFYILSKICFQLFETFYGKYQ